MDAAGATTLDDFVLRAYGLGREALAGLPLDEARRARCERALAGGGPLRAAVADDATYEAWRSAAVRLNTEHYAARVAREPRYARGANSRGPRKIGRQLRLFDCISCDKCIPVCPNDALFAFVVARGDHPVVKARRTSGAWSARVEGAVRVDEPHQIATFADFCNDCGNCDVFCPEDGGPYVIKPRCFGSEAAWRADGGDAFFVDPVAPRAAVRARFAGQEYAVEEDPGGRVRYSGPGFRVTFDPRDPVATLDGEAADGQEIDLTYSRIMLLVREGLLAPGAVNYVSALRP